jgi:hypothetical protein
MTAFMISYDLRKAKDYPTLTENLEKIGAIRVLASVWLLKSEWRAEPIRDWLMKFTDSDDGILVTQIGPDWGSIRLASNAAAVAWLTANL